MKTESRESLLTLHSAPRENTIATPFTDKDTIRVVMLPGGNGEVIGFTNDADGKVSSLNYGGVTFTKLPQ